MTTWTLTLTLHIVLSDTSVSFLLVYLTIDINEHLTYVMKAIFSYKISRWKGKSLHLFKFYSIGI